MTEQVEVVETAVEETPAAPTLQILTPGVTAEETAIVVALFAGMSNGGAPAPKKPTPSWNAPHRVARRALPHGVGGWRASALPR